jgi:TonB family protein
MHIDNPCIWGETPLQKKSLNLSLVDMPERSIPETTSSNLQGTSTGSESDLGELAALFSAHSGGTFSAEVSADLALEIVLNEIVEQACLSTGATGAAIILERDGEMVCRASSGINAPQFGARLESESGLTAECIKTRQVQRCEDALTDPRADAEASRSLGVRSVLIVPLLRNGDLAGLLEIFSSRRGAFGERDELTLEALARRILKNLDRASDALSMSSIIAAGGVQGAAANVEPPVAANQMEDLVAGSGATLNSEEDNVTTESFEGTPRAGINVVTVTLGAAVVLCALLLTTLIVLRVSSRKTVGVHGQETKSPSGTAVVEHKGTGAAQIAGELGTRAVSRSSAASKSGDSIAAGEKKNASALEAGAVRSRESVPPEGGLLVYENGKEVFRMPPAAQGDPARGNESGVERAAEVEPAGTAADIAEGSVLHRVEPEYPEAARQQQMQGPVVLDVRIGRDGSVQDVNVVSGQRVLADAAIAAVKQWRFKPRVLKGQPVEMQTRVTLNFKMPG